MKRSPIGRTPLDWLGKKEKKAEASDPVSPAPGTATIAKESPSEESSRKTPPITESTPSPVPARTPKRRRPKGKTDELLRTTYHVYPELRKKVEEFAYWERMKIFEVVNRALSEFFERHPVVKD